MEGDPLRVTRRPSVMNSSGVWCFLAIGPFRASLWAQGGVYRIQAARGAPRGERLGVCAFLVPESMDGRGVGGA